ncbi:MAG: isochorismatase family protein [Deltaproteobacteria bacterium]|nr:isochorismatase family protein [Deltaproteobacteria bacterium]
MISEQEKTLQEYKKKGFADSSGMGRKPAFVVVDFINAFTDPSSPLGGDYAPELKATAQLLEIFRGKGLPVVFTTVAYEPHFPDAKVFIKKVPSLKILIKGTPAVEVDARIYPKGGDRVLEKKYASAFFGTDLAPWLRQQGVDTVFVAGATTSGCVRATAVDSLQNDFYTIVVRDAVGDRAQGPHLANLLDIQAKYGDVVSLEDALRLVQELK